MEDKDIIKAWECCTSERTNSCFKCPFYKLCDDDNFSLVKATLDLINRQKAENNDLFCKLTGVMHSVDKWLSVDELKQDEVVRAITMREKTLQIVEKLHEKIEELEEEKEMLRASKAEAVKEFAERLKENVESYDVATGYKITIVHAVEEETIDNLVKEMVGESSV